MSASSVARRSRERPKQQVAGPTPSTVAADAAAQAGAIHRDGWIHSEDPAGIAASTRAVEIARPPAHGAPVNAIRVACCPRYGALGLVAALRWTERLRLLAKVF